MSLAILSSSIKGSLRSSARVAAVAKPSSAWTSRFYSTENNNTTETKDNKDATAAAGSTEEKTDKDAKSAHEEALAAKDKQLAEVKVKIVTPTTTATTHHHNGSYHEGQGRAQPCGALALASASSVVLLSKGVREDMRRKEKSRDKKLVSSILTGFFLSLLFSIP